MLLVRKAKKITIGAEITEKSLLVSHDLGLFCLSDELDHVALLYGLRARKGTRPQAIDSRTTMDPAERIHGQCW